jgi:hypothetical protein
MADDWTQIQTDLRAGMYGPWPAIRDRIVEIIVHRNNESGCEGQGVSSSDINHTAYSLVKTGDIEYIFDSELPV